jgi:hypothetical protein
MNEAENKAKQQIVEKIKSSSNILVTVSKDPSVDELSAALGLTVLLNKLDKHVTAIFSGAFPPAITFLDPDKVFENTADSLRDFIIALDKEKADHLRYKVDGDVVKIFITPYRTTINEQDLVFSQGDFNVELVLALGVVDQEHLDTALAANGQMLHDVTIATFSAGEQASHLGSIDWRDQSTSSLSEMVANIGELLKTDKTLLDKQIATALLTGIVSATERFSNPLTSSRVMAMAAQLMAAGADQQLIAAKLQEVHEIDSLPSVSVDEAMAAQTNPDDLGTESDIEKTTLPTDIFSIPHNVEPVDEPLNEPIIEQPIAEVVEPMSVEPIFTEQPPIEPTPVEPIPLPQPDIIDYSLPPLPPTPPTPEYIETPIPTNNIIKDPIRNVVSLTPDVNSAPLLGGILNATSDQAAEDARRELDEQQNKTILSHSYLSGSDANQTAPINSSSQTEDNQVVDIFADGPSPSAPVGLPLPPPLPDYSTLPPPTALPDLKSPFSESASSTLPASAPEKNDPSQFQIPM